MSNESTISNRDIEESFNKVVTCDYMISIKRKSYIKFMLLRIWYYFNKDKYMKLVNDYHGVIVISKNRRC